MTAARAARTRRTAFITGAGLSLLVHVGAVASLAHLQPARIDKAALDGRVTLVPPVEVEVDVALEADETAAASAPAGPAPLPAVVKRAARARRPAAVSVASAAVAAPAPDDVPATTFDEAAAAGSAPPASPWPAAGTVASASASMESDDGAPSSYPEEMEDTGPSHPSLRPAMVGPGIASGLRLYDDFPSLPERLRNGHFRRTLLASVCVSVHGAVSDVHVAAAGVDVLEDALRRSIRTWRYRPLVVDGAATPFCHEISINYRED